MSKWTDGLIKGSTTGEKILTPFVYLGGIMFVIALFALASHH